MEQRQAEKALLLGILEALPCPVVLLNREAQVVYVNERPCPIAPDTVDYSAVEEVGKALREGCSVTVRRDLRDESGKTAHGLWEVHPVFVGEDELSGALCLFHPEPVWEEGRFISLPTVSEVMRYTWERFHILTGLKTPALILGEEGLGIGEFAQMLHTGGPLAARSYEVVTAADGVETLRDKAMGNDGSLCWEEIDNWPAEMLREAAAIAVTRKISTDTGMVPLRARLIATASPGLDGASQSGAFPAELYTRLSVMPLFVPPLRERSEDIVPAAVHMARCLAAHKDIRGIGEEAAAILTRQTWQKNLIELRRVVEEAVESCPGGLIRAEDLGALYRSDEKDPGSLRRLRNAYGRDHVRAMLDIYGYGVKGKRKAAAELGISLSTLYRILGSK